MLVNLTSLSLSPTPQEESEYVQSLGVTVELMNKNIFRELIFAESFMNSNLPLIIAQLRCIYSGSSEQGSLEYRENDFVPCHP